MKVAWRLRHPRDTVYLHHGAAHRSAGASGFPTVCGVWPWPCFTRTQLAIFDPMVEEQKSKRSMQVPRVIAKTARKVLVKVERARNSRDQLGKCHSQASNITGRTSDALCEGTPENHRIQVYTRTNRVETTTLHDQHTLMTGYHPARQPEYSTHHGCVVVQRYARGFRPRDSAFVAKDDSTSARICLT